MRRLFAAFGIDLKKIPQIIMCAQGMHDGMAADPATYAAPNPSLPSFLGLIHNLASAQQVVATRVRGAAAVRDMHRSFLITAMESELTYVQSLADASPLEAKALIQNVGLVIAASTASTKPLLTLRRGARPGSVDCEANVGMLLSAETTKLRQHKFFNWEYTVDGGDTFIRARSTTTGKITLVGLTPLTMVGVRVNLHLRSGPGEWSPVVTFLVR